MAAPVPPRTVRPHQKPLRAGHDAAGRAQRAVLRGPADDHGLPSGVYPIKQLLEDALDGLHRPRANPIEELIDPLYTGILTLDPSPGSGAHAPLDYIPARVYLIDEPEQRLHPALARQAAHWLATTIDRWHAQVILATHSLPFIDLPGSVNVYEIIRPSETAHLHLVDITALTPQSQLTRELGLDHGELLARVRAFLFIESNELADLLEMFCAQRLHASGIAMRRLGSSRSETGLAQIELLAEIVTAPIIAVFTSVDKATIQQHVDAPRAMSEDGAMRTITRLLAIEHRHERHIYLETLDLDALLDQMQSALASDDERAPSQNADLRDLVHRTNQRGLIPAPAPLDDLLWRIDQLTLGHRQGR